MLGLIGWLKKRKEKKIQKEEELEKKLRDFAANLPDKWWEGITVGEINNITVGEITNESIRKVFFGDMPKKIKGANYAKTNQKD